MAGRARKIPRTAQFLIEEYSLTENYHNRVWLGAKSNSTTPVLKMTMRKSCFEIAFSEDGPHPANPNTRSNIPSSAQLIFLIRMFITSLNPANQGLNSEDRLV
jgi:hypothetical protein